MSDYIPEEILVQILKHLSVKSLVQAQCVCKRWKQLIDSPYLVIEHLALQKPRFLVFNISFLEPKFLLLDNENLPFVEILPYSGEKRNLAIMGTLHGIICLYEYPRMTSGIYLWNPATRKLLNIGVPEYMHYDRFLDHYTCSAFWIDPLTKHFKMVDVKIIDNCGAVYSSIEGGWNKVSLGKWKGATKYLPKVEDHGLVMGDIAYWGIFYDKIKVAILSFDFEHERFDYMKGPSIKCEGNLSLCHWQGNLSLVCLDRAKRCDFYIRQEGSWVSLFSINLSFNIGHAYCLLKEVEEEGRILLCETTTCELILFDTRVGCVELKSGEDRHVFQGYWAEGYMAHGFIESIVFP